MTIRHRGHMWCIWIAGDVCVRSSRPRGQAQRISGLVTLESMHEGSGFPVASLGTRKMQRGGGGGGPAPGGGMNLCLPPYPQGGLLPPSLLRGSMQDSPFGQKAPRSMRGNQRLQSSVFLTHALAREHTWLWTAVTEEQPGGGPASSRDRITRTGCQSLSGPALCHIKRKRGLNVSQLMFLVKIETLARPSGMLL
ncbi:hypothetical protein H1C71_009760 [Ictidomys tridecemlineatus]|nr:hypothetical protein H1C71_009760 [Ictidomys tridecemlineatus]